MLSSIIVRKDTPCPLVRNDTGQHPESVIAIGIIADPSTGVQAAGLPPMGHQAHGRDPKPQKEQRRDPKVEETVVTVQVLLHEV